MRHATLRQLKVFEAVARLASFSRAAEELHLTQPAVSTQIKRLQEHAGLPLFEQLGKKIYLTPAGAELLHHSRVIIQQFHEAEAAMAQFKGVAGGKLNVAVISAGDYFFPRSFTCHNPECEERDVEDVALSPTGIVDTYSDMSYPPPPPYVVKKEDWVPTPVVSVKMPEGMAFTS